MLMALGAASSISDLLSTLQKSMQPGQSDGANPFSIAAGGNSSNASSSASSSSASGAASGTLSPNTWAALYAAQSQSGTQGQAPQSPSDALKNLFSLVDSNSDGAISKSEFESNLGAGGTNVDAADAVFSKLDSNGDGSVSLDELSSALKGAGHHHGQHAHGAGGGVEALLSSLGIDSSGTDTSGASGTPGSTDPLLAALQGAQSTSASNSDGSTTTTITYADGTKVTMTTAAAANSGSAAQSTAFNMLEQMIQRQAKALSASASQAVSVTA